MVTTFIDALKSWDDDGSADAAVAFIRERDLRLKVGKELEDAMEAWRRNPDDADACDRLMATHAAMEAEKARHETSIEGLAPDPEAVRMPTMLVPGAVEAGAVCEIFGDPGSGKSTYALLEAVALATGRGKELIGKEVTQSNVCLLWTDESETVMRAKVAALRKKHEISEEDLKGRLHLVRLGSSLDSEHDPLEKVGAEMKALNVQVIYIDSLASNAPTAETANDEAGRLMNRFRKLAATVGAVVFIHHVRKPFPGQQPERSLHAQRGASAIGAAVRVARQCVREDGELEGDEPLFTIDTVKCSNARTPPQAGFRIFGYEVNQETERVPVAEVVSMDARRNPWDGISHAKAVVAWGAVCALPVEERRADRRAKQWMGHALAAELGLPCGTKAEKNRIGKLLAGWLETKHLRETKMKKNGRDVPVLERGTHNLADASD